jgi:hypothetical protein
VTLPHKKMSQGQAITVFNKKTSAALACFINQMPLLSLTRNNRITFYFIISNSNCLLLQYGENLKRLNKFIGETGYCSVVKQIKLSKDELPSMASFLNLAQKFPS